MKIANEKAVETDGPASIGHNSNCHRAVETATDIKNVKALPLERIAIWPALAGSIAEFAASDLADELEILKTDGQRLPVVVRPLMDGRYQAIVRAGLVEVVREHNKLYPEDTREVEVEVSSLSLEDAFRHAANEIAPAYEASSYARGCLYKAALDRYRTAEEVAYVCGVSSAAVSKNLDVYRAVTFLSDKVVVRRDVSQRDAIWLMSVIGRAGDGSDVSDQDHRTRVLHNLERMQPGPARKIFASLRASVKTTKSRRNETPLKHKGLCIGTLRPTPHGGVRIDLPDAEHVPAEEVATIIREALAAVRRVTLT